MITTSQGFLPHETHVEAIPGYLCRAMQPLSLSLKSNRTLRFGGNFTALIVSRIHLEDGSLSLELGYVIAGHLFLSMSFFSRKLVCL